MVRVDASEPFFSLDGPMHLAPPARQTRSANLHQLPRFLGALGADPRRIFEAVGLDPAAVADPDAIISCTGLIDTLEYCSRRFSDPLFGLRFAGQQSCDVFGPLTALCRSAPDFGSALRRFGEYITVVQSPEGPAELLEGALASELRWWTSAELGQNEQANLQALGLVHKLLRATAGDWFTADYVQLASERPRHGADEIEARVGCRVEFSAGRNAIGFASGLLDLPLESADTLTHTLLTAYLSRTRSAGRASTAEQVEGYVRGAIPTGRCTIERCARTFGLSVRALQQKLRNEGISFSDIVGAERANLARRYLGDGGTSLDDLAAMLGYSEQTAFGRAFRRWTGLTPGQFRRGTAH